MRTQIFLRKNFANFLLSKSNLIFARQLSVEVGAKAHLWRTYSEKDVQSFATLSGDTNPIHVDMDYAKRSKFERCVVHGALINGHVSALLGTILPGFGCILANQVLNYTKPLYVGEKFCAEVTITDIKQRENQKQVIDCQYVCVTEEGKKVLDGTARLVLFK